MATTASEANRRAKIFLRALCDPNSKLKIPQLEHSFDRTALRYLSMDSIKADRPGHTSCELLAVSSVCNAMGTLHGGCIATLVDTIGSAALSTIVESSQVSTHMSIDYLAPVKLGDTAVVDATVLQKGGRTGVIEVRIRSKSDGKLAATGIHHKYWTTAFKPLIDMAPRKPQSKL